MTLPRPRARELAVVLLQLALALVVGLHVAWASLRPYGRSDFSTFYLSALEVRRDGDPYRTRLAEPYLHVERERGAEPEELAQPSAVSNLNPPFQTVLLVPLAFVPYRIAEWTWYVLGTIAGVVAGFLTARTWLPHRRLGVWGPAAAIAVLLYVPTLGNSLYNQVGLYLSLAVAVAFWLAERGRERSAAAVLGLLAGLKVFVGLFGVLFLAARRWRAFAPFAGAFGASVIVGGVALGWETYPHYLEALAAVDWHATSWNASVFGGFTRWLGSGANEGTLADRPGAGYLVAQIAALVLGIAYVALVAVRGAQPEREVRRLALALTCTMMILLSPLGWLYYFAALLPGAAALIASARPGRERRIAGAAVVAFLALGSVPYGLTRPEDLGAETYVWWKSDLPLLALLVLGGGQAWLLARRGAGPRRRDSDAESAAPSLHAIGARQR